MKASESKIMCGLSMADVIAKGSASFALSIKLGEEAYDEFYNDNQGWSEECLVFMQLLANRYFNRAMFFLTTSCDNESREEAESLGFRDLQIAMDMDVEIVDQCLEMGFEINRVERYGLMMSRVRGLLALVELGYNPEELFIKDQINMIYQDLGLLALVELGYNPEELFIKDQINMIYQDLKSALKNPSGGLFKEMTTTGRMQKFDMVLMKYFSQARNDNTNAARVAIRMLVEDEYIFPDAEQEAIKVLLAYVNAKEGINYCPNDEDGNIAKELRSVLDSLEDEHFQIRSSTYSSGIRGTMRSLDISIASDFRMKSNTINKPRGKRQILNAGESDKRNNEQRRSSAFKESAIGDVTMESF
eukprot:CAMPEP_0183786576 /NCGR_PEP_ID=MMETSP0739-20130205/67097_1 /TAXON_ID=385413 /ORGANISM="Thalassiosira miniscula, Strain CCMP1093" /LENGTH=359 /DNA_ID=CAMNT_0026030629 /DNA_START=21 /DNA_END=1100 /DNA_ORIENTATION=+